MATTHYLLKWILTLSRVSMLIEPTLVFFLSKAFRPAATWRRREMWTKGKLHKYMWDIYENMWNWPPVSSFSQSCSVPSLRLWHPPIEKMQLHLTWHDIWRIFFSSPSIPVISYFLVLTLPVRGSVADCLSASLCSLAASSTSSSSTKLLNLILETIRLCLRESI